MRRTPASFGLRQSRWTLERLLAHLDETVRVTTPGSLWQLLQRLGIRYKAARAYLHSPDREYGTKRSVVELARLRAQYAPQQYVLLYLDELSYYRQPSLARAYETVGQQQPLAHLSYQSNTRQRVLAALNAHTGQVSYRQASTISVPLLTRFYADLRATYPTTEVIYVVQDNWPVHFHPDVLAALVPQTWPFEWIVPTNWPTQPTRLRPAAAPLPIQLLALPTYASWLNPIEKLWRWLKQDILHLHRQRDDWQHLKQRVAGFLDQFAEGSSRLLHYVGLLPN